MTGKIKKDVVLPAIEEKKSWLERLTMPSIFKIIILTFTVTFIFLIVWQVVTSCSGKVQPIEMSIVFPADSLGVENVALQNAAHLRTLAQEISVQNKAITDKYDLLVRAKETEGNFIRLISAIGALILALLGFLGYRTIIDIENKAAGIASVKAKETAEQYTKEHLEQTVNVKLKALVDESELTNLVSAKVKDELNSTKLKELDQRINELETKDGTTHKEESVDDSSTFTDPNVDVLKEPIA